MDLIVIPCFRRVTLAKAILRAGISPLILAPLRSTPSYMKVGIICAFLTAMCRYPYFKSLFTHSSHDLLLVKKLPLA